MLVSRRQINPHAMIAGRSIHTLPTSSHIRNNLAMLNDIDSQQHISHLLRK
jgi:hypothetical protein